MKENAAVTEIGIAMLGHGFMGGVHSRALRAIGATTWPVPANPALLSIGGRNPDRVEMARRRYGWERGSTNWRDQVEDPRVELFVNVGSPSVHFEPTLIALQRGKHVLCEKPLAMDADDAYTLWAAATAAGVVHASGFNYRFFPALEAGRRLIARGELGEIRHFRSRFAVPNTTSRDVDAGNGGRSGDDGNRGVARGEDATRSVASHHIDAARFLAGEVTSVYAQLGSGSADFVPGDGQERTVQAVMTFENGATGTLEAGLVSSCPAVDSVIEVEGTRAKIRFSLQALNALEVWTRDGVRVVSTCDPTDPFMEHWYPRGHPIGWGDSFTHQMDNILRVIAGESDARALYATFGDGYRCAEICDAMFESARTRRAVSVPYRTRAGDVSGTREAEVIT